MMAKVEWTHRNNQEVGSIPGRSGHMAFPFIQIQGRKKKEILCSRHPCSSELLTGKAAKPWEAAGADKDCGLTEARALD